MNHVHQGSDRLRFDSRCIRRKKKHIIKQLEKVCETIINFSLPSVPSDDLTVVRKKFDVHRNTNEN